MDNFSLKKNRYKTWSVDCENLLIRFFTCHSLPKSAGKLTALSDPLAGGGGEARYPSQESNHNSIDSVKVVKAYADAAPTCLFGISLII